MRKVGLGIVGCGGIANDFHLPELVRIEEVSLVAVADIRSNRAEATASRFKVPHSYTDYRDLLERKDVDAVVVATPHPTHAPIAVDAVKAGKHVLIQKPMATKAEDADSVVQIAAKRKDTKVMVLPFVYFDNPVFEYVKGLVAKDGLGKVCMARIRVAHAGPEKYQEDVAKKFKEKPGDCWFLDREKAEGGALFDMGVYSITMATLLLGKARRVSSFMDTLDKKATVEDSAAMIMEMDNGSIVTVETAWTQARGMNEVALYGVKGIVSWDDSIGTPVVRYYKSSNRTWVIPSLRREKELQHTHRHFVKCILEDKEPIGSPEEGKYLVRIMDAARRSSEEGKIIQI